MFQFPLTRWTRRFGILTLFACLMIGCKKKEESSNSGAQEPQQSGGGERKPRWSSDQEFTALRLRDQNDLKMIGLAMHNYHDNFGGLPPAAICDTQGKPLLSWRVAILPYLEYDNVYKMFKLDEPWDSENNKKLIPMMPKIYLLPGSGVEKDGYTHYRVFTSPANAPGPHPIFFAPSAMSGGKLENRFSLAKITNLDGTSNTIMVAESEDAVIWSKPEDFDYDPKKPLPKIGFFWKDKANILWADGSTTSISKKVSEKTLRNAITVDDGEVLGNDLYDK